MYDVSIKLKNIEIMGAQNESKKIKKHTIANQVENYVAFLKQQQRDIFTTITLKKLESEMRARLFLLIKEQIDKNLGFNSTYLDEFDFSVGTDATDTFCLEGMSDYREDVEKFVTDFLFKEGFDVCVGKSSQASIQFTCRVL